MLEREIRGEIVSSLLEIEELVKETKDVIRIRPNLQTNFGNFLSTLEVLTSKLRKLEEELVLTAK